MVGGREEGERFLDEQRVEIHVPSYTFPNRWATVIVGSRKYHKFSGRRQGCLPHPVEKQSAPPRTVKLTKPGGRNWLQIPLMAPFHNAYKLCIRERQGKYFHLTLCTDCDYLFKVKAYNVFFYLNIIMHYKYLHNNLRTFGISWFTRFFAFAFFTLQILVIILSVSSRQSNRNKYWILQFRSVRESQWSVQEILAHLKTQQGNLPIVHLFNCLEPPETIYA